MTTNNTNLFTPPSRDTDDNGALSRTGSLSPGAITGIVVGSVLGTAVIGTVLGVVLSYMYARKKADFASGPYGTCGNKTYMVDVASYGSSGIPDPSNANLMVVSCNGVKDGSGGMASFPSSYATETGIYIAQIRNYASAGKDLDKTDIVGIFIPTNEVLSEFQTGVVLDEIASMKPSFAVLSVWGDASKILKDKNVIEKLKKMGASQLTSDTSYHQGSPYLFYYEKKSGKGMDLLGQPGGSLTAGPFTINAK